MRALAIVALAAALWSPPLELPGALRTHVQKERFGIVTSLRGLPLGVRDGLQELFGSQNLDIAEPGGDDRSAGRRLVAAGCSMAYCIVYYERGSGTSRTWQVALFRWTPAETRFEWGGLAPRGLTSIDEVRKAMLSGAITGPVTSW